VSVMTPAPSSSSRIACSTVAIAPPAYVFGVSAVMATFGVAVRSTKRMRRSIRSFSGPKPWIVIVFSAAETSSASMKPDLTSR
jgi:hypothetical protein